MKPSLTDIGHFVGGLLVAFLTVHFAVLACLLTFLFCLYEMDESWHINDEAFKDIKIFLLGGFLYASAIFVEYLLSPFKG